MEEITADFPTPPAKPIPQLGLLSLPELIRPTGEGHMSFTSAALWIAAAGGARTFRADDKESWRPLFRMLLDAIASGAVEMIAKGREGATVVPRHIAAYCRVSYPFHDPDLPTGPELSLVTYTYDEHEWLVGLCDKLVDRYGDDVFWELKIRKSDLLRLWPAGAKSAGRKPFWKQRVLQHLDILVSSGSLPDTRVGVARAILARLENSLPADKELPHLGYIENLIRTQLAEASKR